MYSYTERDLLDGAPYHYMYSSFEGPQFLADYFSSRARARRELGPATSSAEASQVVLRIPGEMVSGFETEDILSQLVVSVHSAPASATVRAWVAVFLSKFEANKRLRRSYGPDLKARNHETVRRRAYGHLAYLIAMLLSDSNQLKFLNALLKLNDLVLSGQGPDGVDAGLLAYALDREVACVCALAEKLAVRVPAESIC